MRNNSVMTERTASALFLVMSRAQSTFLECLSRTVKGSQISPSERHQPLKSMHQTSFGALASSIWFRRGHSEQAVVLWMRFFFSKPDFSRMRLMLDNEGGIAPGWVRW